MKHNLFCLAAAAIIIAFLLLIPVEGGAQSGPTPTPECYWMEGTLVCISGVVATIVPSTPTPQPDSPLFPVVWFPAVMK